MIRAMRKISQDHESQFPAVASTGVAGLDALLSGGLARGEMHMAQGIAGTGKTTLALHFLREGARLGEPCLYVTLAQSAPHLLRIARAHGWSMDGIAIHEMSPMTVAERLSSRQTVLASAEVELDQLFHELDAVITQVKPMRAVVDTITIFQMLAGNRDRYHREIVTLRQMFIDRDCTLLITSDHPAEEKHGSPPEVVFHSLCGCIVYLDQEPRQYGDAHRRLRVLKTRGRPNTGGFHDVKIFTGGLSVFQRLGAYELPEKKESRQIGSGIAALDRLLGGGLEAGTSCLIVGPSGVGKSCLATAFAAAVAAGGDHAAIYLFDERPETFITRAEGVGIPLRAKIEAGNISLQHIDPGMVLPGEFAHRVRAQVEAEKSRVVVIDSVRGYFATLGSADLFVTQFHELLTYLTKCGILLIMCGPQESFLSIGAPSGVDVSYLSDTILILKYYEVEARIHRCIAALKKPGPHRMDVHELHVNPGAISVGEQPLTALQHLLIPAPQPVDGRLHGNGKQ